MSTAVYDNTDNEPEDTTARDRTCQPPADGTVPGASTGPAPVFGDADETAGQMQVKGADPEQDTSVPTLVETPAAPRKLVSTAQTRGHLMLVLSLVRITTAAQLAIVITREGTGTGYMRRGLRDLRTLGYVDYGRHGRELVWHLTTLGQRAVADGGDITMRPHVATGERAIAAGLAPHGLAVTEVISRWGGPILDWEVEVDHTIDKVRRVVSDAVLHRPARGSEVESLELDRFTMPISRLALNSGSTRRTARPPTPRASAARSARRSPCGTSGTRAAGSSPSCARSSPAATTPTCWTGGQRRCSGGSTASGCGSTSPRCPACNSTRPPSGPGGRSA
ncbi:replication-relaxation family protein [Streptomyces sp. NPDC002561]|uniref:replication-relaxation family protein n=1 Tax=Streptomyces sp. NPDC002561 TaxID=3154418 RepID=UPI0033304EB8